MPTFEFLRIDDGQTFTVFIDDGKCYFIIIKENNGTNNTKST